MLVVSSDPIHTSQALRAFETRAPNAGGIVSFSGQVRGQSDLGQVRMLHLQAYSPMTENGITKAIETANARWALEAVQVNHRIGDIAPGETIVFVATASKHRRAAFEAADFLMDYLKTEAVFWKKETIDTGTHWIEPRAEDYTDASRWIKRDQG
ncbi:MAG: molybdenum cofactor biosynthesis protein MoaE [Pseudomonadota bacterium]